MINLLCLLVGRMVLGGLIEKSVMLGSSLKYSLLSRGKIGDKLVNENILF